LVIGTLSGGPYDIGFGATIGVDVFNVDLLISDQEVIDEANRMAIKELEFKHGSNPTSSSTMAGGTHDEKKTKKMGSSVRLMLTDKTRLSYMSLESLGLSHIRSSSAPPHKVLPPSSNVVSRDIPIGHSLIRVQLWDTAGRERFQSIYASYFR
jgi:hypothetical protein